MILPPRPPRAFPCPLSGEQKPEAGCGKVRGQPLVSVISHVRYIFLKKGRALFQASFAPQARKPEGSRAKARGAVTHLSWQQQLLVGRLIINMCWLATETLEMRLVVCTPPPQLAVSVHDTAVYFQGECGHSPRKPVFGREPLFFLVCETARLPGEGSKTLSLHFIYLFI